MKKLLFTLLISGICALHASAESSLESSKSLVIQVGIPVPIWDHNLDAGTSVRVVRGDGEPTVTRFRITRERSTKPKIELPDNPEFDTWYPFYLTGSLNLKAEEGDETVESLAFSILHSELKVRRVETARKKSQHDFENDFTKEFKGLGKVVKRYNIYGCECVTWHTELYRRVSGVETLVETSPDQVVHEIGGVVASCTNPREQGGSIIQLPNRGAGISSGHLIGNTLRTFVKKI